jgi:hypothetical protein
MNPIISGNTSPIDTWEIVAEFYSHLVTSGWDLSPMVDLIENIAASRYAAGIYAKTSIATLCISQHQNIEWNRVELLRIDFSKDRFIFTYQESPLNLTRWEITSDRVNGFSTFEHVMQRLNWFLD